MTQVNGTRIPEKQIEQAIVKKLIDNDEATPQQGGAALQMLTFLHKAKERKEEAVPVRQAIVEKLNDDNATPRQREAALKMLLHNKS